MREDETVNRHQGTGPVLQRHCRSGHTVKGGEKVWGEEGGK